MDIIKPVILENKKSAFTWQFIDRGTSVGNDSGCICEQLVLFFFFSFKILFFLNAPPSPVYTHMQRNPLGGQKKVSEPMELSVFVSPMAWVLELNLGR